MKRLLLLVAILIFMTGKADAQEEKGFVLPSVPKKLKTPQARADYLVLHYWDNFNFSDTSLIDNVNITEQAFSDYVSVLPYAQTQQAAADTLVSRAAANKQMLLYFAELAEKYLYDLSSPQCNEELHIPFLKALVASSALTELEKSRWEFLLEMELKNRMGGPASDFEYIERNGNKGSLYNIEADFVLLFLNDPVCSDCRYIKTLLATTPIINSLIDSGKMMLLSVSVEGNTQAWRNSVMPQRWIDSYDPNQAISQEPLYNLKAMPTLYLLDSSKRVVLKDCTLEQLQNALAKENL